MVNRFSNVRANVLLPEFFGPLIRVTGGVNIASSACEDDVGQAKDKAASHVCGR